MYKDKQVDTGGVLCCNTEGDYCVITMSHMDLQKYTEWDTVQAQQTALLSENQTTR